MLTCSNNTNKLSPQELNASKLQLVAVQIIQINLVLKNCECVKTHKGSVQIIQINLVLKNNGNKKKS